MTSNAIRIPERCVIDTVALVQYLTVYEKLGKQAKAVFAAAEEGRSSLIISPILIGEFYYWNGKHDHFDNIQEVLDEIEASSWFEFVPLTVKQAREFLELRAIPEMHDRLIAGHARKLGLPLVTNDPMIIDSNYVPIIW
ncbi:MAG: PIN domain-containing protein [Anaerolineaceae bacterium]|nr:PIN domain-containing protein [Anaerolineaceae bacterium]MCY4023353.1 PIN domain-containing protein [Anaerolineaceae bacterium]